MMFMCTEMRNGLRAGKEYIRGTPNDPSFVSIRVNDSIFDYLISARPYSTTDALMISDIQAEDWLEVSKVSKYDLNLAEALEAIGKGKTVELRNDSDEWKPLLRLRLLNGKFYVSRVGLNDGSYRPCDDLVDVLGWFSSSADVFLKPRWRVLA